MRVAYLSNIYRISNSRLEVRAIYSKLAVRAIYSKLTVEIFIVS